MRMFVAENDLALATFLHDRFRAEHYTLDLTGDGEEVQRWVEERNYHVVILDRNLVRAEAAGVVQFVRSKRRQMPIVVLYSRNRAEEGVQFLDVGADDLVLKPFAFSELCAQVRGLLRRGGRSAETVPCIEDLELNRGIVRVRRSVWRGKEVSTKTKKGYRNVLIDSGTFQILRQHLGTRTSGRVFQSRSASPLDTSNVLSEVLYPLCDRLLIPRGGLHAFRHGRVSHLQTSGVPADFTKSQVGHSSLRMTSNYTHFSEQFQRETVERLASKSMFCTQPSDLYSVAMPAKAV